MRAISASAIFLLLFSAAAFADFSGTINFSNSGNRSAVTGIWAYTVDLCNSTSNCMPQGVGLACFFDYDNFSRSASYGWCNASSTTNCYHNNSAYSSGTNICVTNITTRACSSGAWLGVDNCSSGQTCPSEFGTPGNCTGSSSSSSSSSGSSSTTNTTSRTSSIIFTSAPLNFEMTQGESVVRVVAVKNNGNATLYNITLSSSLTWASVTPVKWNQSVKNNETGFTINFTAPSSADVKTYAVTIEVTTHNTSARASKSFSINLKPSNQTVQEQIFPEYGRYVSLLSELESNVTSLKSAGANVEEIESLLLNARSKLYQVNQSLEAKDYFTAQQLLDDVRGLLDAASSQAGSIELPSAGAPADFTFMIILAVIAGVVVFVIYLVLPPKKSKSKASSFLEKSYDVRNTSVSGEKKGFLRKKK